jgi:hypothetical protein
MFLIDVSVPRCDGRTWDVLLTGLVHHFVDLRLLPLNHLLFPVTTPRCRNHILHTRPRLAVKDRRLVLHIGRNATESVLRFSSFFDLLKRSAITTLD